MHFIKSLNLSITDLDSTKLYISAICVVITSIRDIRRYNIQSVSTAVVPS